MVIIDPEALVGTEAIHPGSANKSAARPSWHSLGFLLAIPRFLGEVRFPTYMSRSKGSSRAEARDEGGEMQGMLCMLSCRRPSLSFDFRPSTVVALASLRRQKRQMLGMPAAGNEGKQPAPACLVPALN